MDLDYSNKQMNLLVLIVVYKCSLKESKTIDSLTKCKENLPQNTKIVIWDNSPLIQEKEQVDFCKSIFKDVEYCHTGENLSLAKVYNKIINKFNKDYNFVNIWDQDSSVTSDYFEEFYNVYTKTDVSLYVPQVFQGNLLVSPGEFKFCKGVYLKNISSGIVPSSNIIGIGSGLIIDINVFKKIQFEENLKLYGIDTCFFMDYALKYNKLYVLDYRLKHSMSAFEEEPKEKKVARYMDWRYSMMIIAKRKNKLSQVLIKLYVLAVSVKFAMKYKTNIGVSNKFGNNKVNF